MTPRSFRGSRSPSNRRARLPATIHVAAKPLTNETRHPSSRYHRVAKNSNDTFRDLSTTGPEGSVAPRSSDATARYSPLGVPGVRPGCRDFLKLPDACHEPQDYRATAVADALGVGSAHASHEPSAGRPTRDPATGPWEPFTLLVPFPSRQQRASRAWLCGG